MYMESSQEGRLGLRKIPYFSWKGKTFKQISSTIQKNNLQNAHSNNIFRALPLKHYRREVAITTPQISNGRISTSVTLHHDIPGGTTRTDVCNGVQTVNDFNYNESKTEKSCNACSEIKIDSMGLSQADNARRRVRSAGMNRKKFDEEINNRPNNYASASEYLHSRNRTFKQNQFTNLRNENQDHEKNVYSSNTLQFCANPSTNYVPVYYKPNNQKFANQGAVDSSARLARLKYDTITDSAGKTMIALGKHTANALAYGVPVNGYTIKDKMGYPNARTPVFKDGKHCNDC